MTKIEILIDKKLITPDWAAACEKAFLHFYEKIVPVVKAASVEGPVYPEQINTFRAFKECPVDKVKVVILGQDPYHDGTAIGLCFDNMVTNKKISPSLKNILIEMDSDLNGYSYTKIKTSVEHSFLGHLPSQGVLMINTALTVEAGKPNSHSEIWKPFTGQIIEFLNTKDDIVWILWGNYAKGFKKLITNKTHKFVEGAHPSPLSANRGGFFGGKYFSKTNEYLKNKISW